MPVNRLEHPEKMATLFSLLRGLLAVPSGSEDDPYRRVILQWSPARAPQPPSAPHRPPPLNLEAVCSDAPADELRKALQQAIARYEAQWTARPCEMQLGGGTWLSVEPCPQSDARPLAGKVAMVTGAAGAIGAGICRALVAGGARVAATDVNEQALQELTSELSADATAIAPCPITMDVTDEASVAAGFDRIAGIWGGVDIVVVNAGVALVASLAEMKLEAFRRLERVNVEGSLLTLAEAGRRLSLQGTGGDMVLISTKNVFAPGAQFGAYSATKAAAHQLARIASLELAPFGIRVNMVAPDAVFAEGSRKSGLWAEVGPSRMRARGLDEKGLEEYYRNRNLLKARVTARHVANAVLFFVTRQTPTTGATIPVDGGLPDSTPR
jgi:NAD(P)-dependent dehydrogenase (short-subunit alcohol dehydrogenase family)